LDQSRTGLTNYLFQEVRAADQLPEPLFSNNRLYLKRLKDAAYPENKKAEIVREVVEDFVDAKLRFPSIGELTESVDVTLDYYDVSDELLKDEEFRGRLNKAGVDPRKYGQGYEQNGT
jgi:hypothetical protein